MIGGDHGMTDDGAHGGALSEEVSEDTQSLKEGEKDRRKDDLKTRKKMFFPHEEL